MQFSLIGGLSARVPADARITLHAFALGGHSVERAPGSDSETGSEISIWSLGLRGGTKVRRVRGA
ncbi:MAG: hypothetical protein BGO11_21835 [Solirubrobacterales bacterium 70-9]|nr:MAG: hypothetical protein BGO11_21835 [Solirubrobacterales bacterium 70-9]